MTSGDRSICLASGGRVSDWVVRAGCRCCAGRSERLHRTPGLARRSCVHAGRQELPRHHHHGYSVTAGYKAIKTTKLYQIWYAVDIKPVWLPAAMESSTAGPTDTARHLTADTLRDGDYCEFSSVTIQELADFIGWRLENFRHLLASPARAHHLPERRG